MLLALLHKANGVFGEVACQPPEAASCEREPPVVQRGTWLLRAIIYKLSKKMITFDLREVYDSPLNVPARHPVSGRAIVSGLYECCSVGHDNCVVFFSLPGKNWES